MESARDELERIWRTLHLDNLEARLVLCEIRRVGLTSEFDSPETTPERKAEAVAERDQVLIEWAEIMTRLEEFKKDSAEFSRF